MRQIAPPPLPLPKMAAFVAARRMTTKEVAADLETSYETVRRMMLPFGDVNRCVPSTEMMERIHAWSGGELTPASFYPPKLNGDAEPEAVRPADEDYLRRDFLSVGDPV